jgi:hypothetical protein
MRQKSRLVLVASWLVLRLRWSLIFLRTSLDNGGIQRWWSTPGIILFSRRHNQFPLDRWSFEEQRSAYLHSSPTAESLRVCFLPEISQN